MRVLAWPWWHRTWHWLNVACCVGAFVTSFRADTWHEIFGYGVLGMLSLRALLGFSQQPSTRWSAMWHSARRLISDVHRHRLNQTTLHHNSLGVYMASLLIALGLCAGFSGWLYTQDAFWGVDWVHNLHYYSAWAFVLCIPLHILGVLWTSYRQRQNLLASMCHGYKDLPS